MDDNELLQAVGFFAPADPTKSEAPYTEGPFNASICFVGEAPGEQEERMQRPFVEDAPAGGLLTRLCASAGINRHNCRIENVFQFRPFNNDVTPYISYNSHAHKVNTSKTFDLACASLRQRLERCTANVIVPLGNPALYALTGKWGISKWRGSILESTLLPGRKVIPAIHPSAALRQWSDQPLIIHDFTRAKAESTSPEIHLLDRQFILEPNMMDIITFIEDCHHQPMVAFDIEVTHKRLSHISLATSPTNCICIPFYDRGRDYFTVEQEADVMRRLAALLRDTNVVKLAHNAVFDAGFLFAQYGIVTQPLDDTMVANRIVQPDMPASLAFAVSIYCNGEPYYKDDGKLWYKDPATALAVDPLQFRRYNAMDSAVLMEIFPQLITDLKRQGNYDTYRHQVALVEPLVFMQTKGIVVDAAAMRKASDDALTRINELQAELTTLVGYAINANSPDQVMEYFYDIRGQKPFYKTTKDKTGARKKTVTCDVKALRRLSAKGFREATIILEIRKLAKMRGTYYDMVLDEDNRMRCSYNPVGTRYGRISSSKTIFKTGANLLNQPKAMKKLMHPEPNNIFVNIDLSQAENRCVAFMWNVTRMCEAFNNEVDIHCLTATTIFNKPIDQISDEEGSTDIGNGTLSERGIGKRANHAFNYGLGAEKFSINNEIDLATAKYIHERYHAMYPEIKLAHRRIEEQLNQVKVMINAYGRKYFIMRRWGSDLFEAAYAFGPQSTIADKLNRDGFIPAYYDSAFEHLILVNQVYDSIVFEYPLEYKHELQAVCAKICQNLERPIQLPARSFVIPPDVAIGFNLGEMRKIKLAQVYDPATFNVILEDVIGKNIN